MSQFKEKIIFVDFEFYSKNADILVEISAFTYDGNIKNVFSGFFDPCINDIHSKWFLTMNKFKPECKYKTEVDLYSAFYKVSKEYERVCVFGSCDTRSLDRSCQNNGIENKIELYDLQSELSNKISDELKEPIKLSGYSNILGIKPLNTGCKSEVDANLLMQIYNRKQELYDDTDIKKKISKERLRPSLSFDYTKNDPEFLIKPKLKEDFNIVWFKTLVNKQDKTKINYEILIKNKNTTHSIEFNKDTLFNLLDNSVFITKSWRKIREIFKNEERFENKVFYKLSSTSDDLLEKAWDNESIIKGLFNNRTDTFQI
ncbi:MAG: hypothetical protein ACRC42_02310 [Mycoplasma sp.]